MHKIDSNGSVNGQWSAGNPASGQQATQLVADWFNAIQGELVYLVEEAGLDLEKADTTQIYQAVLAIAVGAAGAGGGAVPTDRLISAGGIATGGGDLTVNRTITVTKASAAEVAAGTDDTKAITPLALQGGLGAKLLAGTGYVTLFGVLFQWGTATATGNGSTNVNLPIAFPAQCVIALFNGGHLDNDAQDNNPYVSGKSATALTVFNAVGFSIPGQFLAIGF